MKILKLWKNLSISILLLIILLLSYPAFAFEVEAETALLMEVETGQVLFSKNAHDGLPPASMTKIMTMLLTMEALEEGYIDLEEEVVTSRRAASKGGSQIYLSAGERMPVQTLLEAVAIASANDATVALSEHVAGSKEEFVRMMNRRAEQLGMNNTKFVNTTGLPVVGGNHYASAYDIALMSRELILNYPEVLDWTAIWMDEIRDGEFILYNTNKLLRRYPGVDGLKTGWTTEAGYSLAATATRDGRRLISVIMKTDSEEERLEESAKLLNYGFRRFNVEDIVSKGELVGEVEVQEGKQPVVNLETANDLRRSVLVGSRDEIEREIVVDENITAPVEKGKVLGELILSNQNEELGRVELVAAEEVEQLGFLARLLRRARELILGFLGRI
ncbi:D-alanyl-D-alanine carboxypeptidase family protein [Fuchsiella alkaliacetigena]|uniref:D-alanyl-D-alanine carboxypeptidase family protein n=1 Tax=Fuchsiella alkaliacetigena TaxID=957042 RepID=UPI00200B81F1|nr:D-alanyl-D-alanine carboxypeptidase family protein [Fuchsiella alkaliacetigena]MCK8824909.1 D-alanyl-D-alanine carboxypeptidase [Fuchsiella alkaliacetigena]